MTESTRLMSIICRMTREKNMIMKIELRPIGVVERSGTREAKIRIFPEFCAGLKGIEEFSHLIILYWIHLRDNVDNRMTLLVFPRMHAVNVQKGVFACRSPSRPNPVGLCIVRLTKVENSFLTMEGLDALEASPVIDIKPYIPRSDAVSNAHVPDWTWSESAT